MIEGKAKCVINDKNMLLKAGDFLFVDANNIVGIEYTEDSKIFAMHSPSIPTDKVVL